MIDGWMNGWSKLDTHTYYDYDCDYDYYCYYYI